MDEIERIKAQYKYQDQSRLISGIEFLLTKVEQLQKEWTGMKSEIQLCHPKIFRLEAEVEQFKTENYNDLLDQMDAKGWGNFHEINTEEVYAFINSRATHKPATKLRTKNKRLCEALEEIRVEASARKETAIIWRIDEALKDSS